MILVVAASATLGACGSSVNTSNGDKIYDRYQSMEREFDRCTGGLTSGTRFNECVAKYNAEQSKLVEGQ